MYFFDRLSGFYRENSLYREANSLFRGSRPHNYLSIDHDGSLECCLRRIKPAQQRFPEGFSTNKCALVLDLRFCAETMAWLRY